MEKNKRKLKLAEAVRKKKEVEQLKALEREERLQRAVYEQIEELKKVIQGGTHPEIAPIIDAVEATADKADIKELYLKVEQLLKEIKDKEPIKIPEVKVIEQKAPVVNLPKIPDHKKELQSVIVNLENLRKELKEEAEKKGQRPEDYIPVRRVRKQGNRLEFDDDQWTGGGGGGTNGIVDLEKISGNPIDVGSGNASNGTQRIVIADDQAAGIAQEATLSTLNNKIPDVSGTWGYQAGTAGTEILTGGKRVLQITAIALEAQGTITIDGGDTIILPYGSTDKVSSAITIIPVGNLTDPTIIFTATDSYFIEYVS